MGNFTGSMLFILGLSMVIIGTWLSTSLTPIILAPPSSSPVNVNANISGIGLSRFDMALIIQVGVVFGLLGYYVYHTTYNKSRA